MEPKEIEAGGAAVAQIKLTPGAQIEVAEGVVRLSFDPHALTLAPSSSDSFNAKRSSQARILEEGSFALFAKDVKVPTEANLRVSYTTKYGAYQSPAVAVRILPRRNDSQLPFIERSGSKAINLSGEWRIQVGASPGNLKIQQDARNDVEGEYWFSSSPSTKLPAKGYKDGTSFKVFFWRDIRGTQRWFVDANFAVNAQDSRFIEMKGCAFLITQDAGMAHDSPAGHPDGCAKRDFVGWRGIGASGFYATAQMR